MKRLILIIILCSASFSGLIAQNLLETALDTNGPMGECLFPQDENGEIVMSGVVECSYTVDTIKALLREWAYEEEYKNDIDFDDLLDGISKLEWEVEIPVGVDLMNIGGVAAFYRDKSQVKFYLTIDIRDYKFKYTLYNFYTHKRMIRGESKSEGPTNMIYWQRVNSLTKEAAAKKNKKKKAEIEALLEDEKIQYQCEYAAVCDFIDRLRSAVVISEDF